MANPHPEETFAALVKSDPQLKTLPVDKYGKLAPETALTETKKALEAKKVNVQIFDKPTEALEFLKKLVPAGKSVGNSHSTTLEEIGFVEFLKTEKSWVNLHVKIFSEPDHSKHGKLYRDMHAADFYFSSATAISQQGDILAADLTGTKVGAFNHAAGHLVLVCGTQKIVPTFADAVKRTEEFCLPLESARARIAYKVPGSAIGNLVSIRNPNPFLPNPRVTVVFVKQQLGY